MLQKTKLLRVINVENVLASLDEEQVAKENALASYKRELEELDSMDVKRR